MSYQWYRNGTLLAGETNSTVALTDVQAGDAADYTVVVTNRFGSVTSSAAKLVVGTLYLPMDPQALSEAVGIGGYYAFAGNGVISLPSTLVVSNDLSLDAAGHTVVIDGGNSVQLMQVRPGTKCHLTGITLANGVVRATIGVVGSAVFGVGGGAIYNQGGSLELDSVTFTKNQASCADVLVVDGYCGGGALCNDAGGNVIANFCRWQGNAAMGEKGYYDPHVYDEAVAPTDAAGGAILNKSGKVTLIDCLLANNVAKGGDGAVGGIHSPWFGGGGSGGGILNQGQLTLLGCTLEGNLAVGGSIAGPFFSLAQPLRLEGDVTGGGVANFGDLWSTNTTWHSNAARAAFAEAWQQDGVTYIGSFGGRGGGLFSGRQPNVVLSFNTFSGNAASTNGIFPENTQVFGLSGAICVTNSVVHVQDSIIANSSFSSNCVGLLIDDGHNLSSDSSCNFTNVSSRNNVDPRLGPLADNGGPTPTMLLLPGSPAIDAASFSDMPATDQRGITRPQSAAPDIGAVEVRPEDWTASLSAGMGTDQRVLIRVQGAPDKVYRLLRSPLATGLDWTSIATNKSDAFGQIAFEDPVEGATRFYRVVTP